MDYETGVAVAALIKVYSLAMTTLLLNSLHNKNLNKIGMRLSWLTLAAKPMDSDGIETKLAFKVFKGFLILAYSLTHIFFSWAFVAYVAFLMMWQFHKRSGIPQSVKEFNWKLKNIDMTKEQIIEEFVKLDNMTPEQTQLFKNEIEYRLKQDTDESAA